MPGTDFAFENDNIALDWAHRHVALKRSSTPTVIPQGVVERIEDGSVLDKYKQGKEMACADIVICTRKPDGKRAVLLSLRKLTESFGGEWWIHGGSVGAYQDVLTFIAKRAERECGVPVKPEVLIGFYRTSAADKPQSTTQPCFAAAVPYEVLEKKMQTDANHESVRLFTEEDLEGVLHWYPKRVAHLAITNMPA